MEFSSADNYLTSYFYRFPNSTETISNKRTKVVSKLSNNIFYCKIHFYDILEIPGLPEYINTRLYCYYKGMVFPYG